MKSVVNILFFVFTTLVFAQTEHYAYQLFQEGETYVTYGNDVILRATDDRASENLGLIPVNTSLKILKRSTKTISLNNQEPQPWLKVSYKGKLGYVAGALLAIGKVRIPNTEQEILYNYADFKKDQSGLSFRKVLGNNYEELGTYPLYNTSFSLALTNPKGLSGLDYLIQLNYLAEACGVEGGYSLYAYHDKKNLIELIGHASSIGDGGVYYVSELLVLPDDENGEANTIIYKHETEEIADEEGEEVRKIVYSKKYKWLNGKLVTPIKSYGEVYTNGDY